MDFTFTEEQETIAKVARQLFEHRATPEHLTELEAGDVRYDAGLWRELATADLLGIALPENVGGSGRGFVELALLLAEVGWSVAPVPAYATLLLGADTIARYGDDAQRTAVPARRRRRLMPPHRGIGGARSLRPDPSGDHGATRRRRLAPRRHQGAGTGGAARPHHAHSRRRSTTATSAVFLVDADADGVEIRPAATTNGEPHADVFLDGAVVSQPDRLAGDGDEMTRIALRPCARRAVRDPARCHRACTAHRRRPTRPNASSSAGRSAASRPCSNGWPTPSSTSRRSAGPCGRPHGCSNRAGRRARQAAIAKFWAAEAGARVAATAQQVHGGIGIDTTYPLFRYFLWAKHNELTLGSASAQLARLGATYVGGDL